MTSPTAEDLLRVPLLAALADHLREQLAPRFRVADFAAGERILVEGSPGQDVYFVDRGRATADQRERGLVRLLGPGDFFGEIALLGKGERTATVTASSPMVVWILPGYAISELRRDHADIADALTLAMQDRLATD